MPMQQMQSALELQLLELDRAISASRDAVESGAVQPLLSSLKEMNLKVVLK